MTSGQPTQSPIRSICVFCGSSAGRNSVYTAAAQKTGEWIAKAGLELIYGAGNVGMMGVLASAAVAAGGRVVGVIPHALVERELAHPDITELHVVDTMHQRKALMSDRADAFLALPGGYGTLDELFEILTWVQLGIHARPVGLLDVAGYFHPLLNWLDHMVNEGFLRQQHRDLLMVGEEPEELLRRILTSPPAAPVSKWITREDL